MVRFLDRNWRFQLLFLNRFRIHNDIFTDFRNLQNLQVENRKLSIQNAQSIQNVPQLYGNCRCLSVLRLYRSLLCITRTVFNVNRTTSFKLQHCFHLCTFASWDSFTWTILHQYFFKFQRRHVKLSLIQRMERQYLSIFGNWRIDGLLSRDSTSSSTWTIHWLDRNDDLLNATVL